MTTLLARRQALRVAVIAMGMLLLSGLTEMWFSYREARAQVSRLQQAQASAVAREIGQYLRNIEAGLRDTAKQPWGDTGFKLARQREELLRLMVLFPALAELHTLDDQGRELLFISRTEPSRQGHGVLNARPVTQQATTGSVTYGRPYFQNGAEPHVLMTVREAGTAGQSPHDSLVAVVHLRVVADALARLSGTGRAYLIDDQDRLIAHPTQIEMLRQRDMHQRPEVRAARAALAAGASDLAATESSDLDGQAVIATAVALPETGWLLFLEQPRATVMEPALETLKRTTLLILLAALAAALASAWQGGRLAQPILALRRASARIAGGDFSTPVELHTGDELELLAQDLNSMAHRLGRFYQELEEQVVLRTEELVAAREVAERASQAKTRFLAAASHDLRQPMHTIGLLVTLMRSRIESPELLALAQKLSMSVEVMERLFSSLLDISKLDAGAVQPQPETFAVQDLLDRIAQRFEAAAAEAGLQLLVRPSRVVIHSDPGLLERCLSNLVSNALRYTEHGRVLVGCRLRGHQLAIQVHDTGIGIPAEHLDAIFEEFVRLPSAQMSPSKGLGLGLPIVRRTAELLGHAMRVRSKPGQGSMFELLVPLRHSSAQNTLPPQAGISAAQLRGLFVLVVDDDTDNREALEALCTQWGCLVATAASAAQALAALDAHLRTPDLVLTDLRLGADTDEDGLSMLAALRRTAEFNIPAVIVTAETTAGVQQRARALDVLVLHKPATADRLAKAIRSLLDTDVARSKTLTG
ncbi:MAG TPA: ATP-binding protein [Ideonella sp.]|uniref:hybrid sensor histidine kinase/response regulator n=1 Tax=Ideonella sp. TaxID=1929293 RepID=UPI002C862E21|nr:ATP-binding protein [Ideonella sp.]HSI51558.1 ATP-binding protein [Ideonella sp.]